MRILSLAIILFFSCSAFGAVKTWTGAGADANWATAANWNPSGAPAASDDLVFPANAPQQANNNNTMLLTLYRSITVEGGAYTFSGNLIRLSNGITVNGGTQAFNIAITLSAPQTFLADGGGTATIAVLSAGSNALTIDGAGLVGIGLLSGSGAITKNGAGAGAIIASAGFSGPITVNDGVFVVDANIPNSTVNVNSQTVPSSVALSGFGGTGTVGATTVTQGAISAGTLTSPTGVLNISGGLTFTANGGYACKIGGTSPGANGHDQLNVTGSVALNNAVLVPIPWANFRPAIGDTLVILKNDGTDPISGTFLNMPEGAVFAGPLNTAFRITYHGGDGNDAAITRVAHAPFDFDGDGKTDISTFDTASANWDILFSGSSQGGQTFGLTTDKIAPADYDGDNKTDIAVFRGGTWWILSSFSSTVSATQFGSTGDVPVPNDFDGDGRADLAIFRPSSGIWYELRSLGSQFYAQQFGMNGDIPQIADIDGDGLGDLAVYRPSDGTWHFWQSSTSSYLAFPFGIATDKPVIADYDGDGRSDVAVFRGTADPAQPDFYILLTNGWVYYGSSWGVPGDVPVVGDYDGDGRSDIAVFRPSTKMWYILGSTAGFSSTAFGPGDPAAIPAAFIP